MKDYSPSKRKLKDRVRWKLTDYIRRFVRPRSKWTYITLGGPQLFDVKRLLEALDPPQYPNQIISCYQNPRDDQESAREAIKVAERNANELQRRHSLRSGISIIPGTVEGLALDDIQPGNMVVMFLDFERSVSSHLHEIAACVSAGLLKPRDFLFVTSCVNEKFVDGNRQFRVKAAERVAAYVGTIPVKKVTTDLILRYHDFYLIWETVRTASFQTADRRLDCRPLGPLLVYKDTVRMLWLPLRIVHNSPTTSPSHPRLQYLRRA